MHIACVHARAQTDAQSSARAPPKPAPRPAPGQVLNYAGVTTPPTPAEVCAAAARAVTFLDLGGHHAFLKTTLFGLTSLMPGAAPRRAPAAPRRPFALPPHGCKLEARGTALLAFAGRALAFAGRALAFAPLLSPSASGRPLDCRAAARPPHADYALLCVCAPAGVTPTTRQHLALAVALDVPAALVVTKCDAAAPGRLAATMAEVAALAADAAAPHTAANPGGEAVAGAGAGALLEVGSEAAAAAAAQELSELRAAAPGAHAHAPAQRRFPVFRVSSVTGTGLDSLHAFLSRLRPAARGGEGEGAGDGGAGEEAAGGGGLREGRLLLMEGAGAAGGSAASSGTPRGCGSSSGLSSSTSSDAGGEGEGEARRRGAAAAAPPLAGGAAARGAGAGRHFQVFHTFDVEGVAVACGICVEGGVTLGQRLLWGPTEDGGFVPAVVTGIQRGQVPVRVVRPGQTATLALEPPAAHHAGGGAGGAGAERDAAVAAAAAADAVRRCQEQHRRARAKSQIEAEVLALRSEYGSSFCSGGGGGVGSSDPPGGPPAPARGGAGGPPSGGGGSDSSRAASDGGVAGVGGFCGALDAAADALADLLASDGGSDGGGGEFGCEGAHGGDDFDLLGSFDLGSAEERGGSASSCGSSGSSGSSCTAAAAAAALVGAGRSGAPATPPPPAPLGVQRSAPVPVPAAPPAGGLAAGDGTLLGCSPSSARKGGVLLGASAAPRTHWEFEAALMLLGGSWRPRASGASSGDEPCSSGGGDAPARGRARRRRGARELCFVVHCGSVRQVARVVELSDAPAACGCGDSCHGDGCSGGCGRRTPAALPASIATAAALLRGARGAGSAGAPGGGDAATARFRFVHRPEWLRPGARVILRDRSDGHVAAAGCITQLSP